MEGLTQEQKQKRVGFFTASEIYKLIPYGTRPMTPSEIDEAKARKDRKRTVPDGFTDGGMTYIKEKVTERLTGIPVKNEFTSASVEWGKKHEKEAEQYYYSATGDRIVKLDTLNKGLIKGTPDDVIIKNNVYVSGLEIKCPYNSQNHTDDLMLRDYNDIRKNITNSSHRLTAYYWQMVTYMYLTGVKTWKYCSYDPRFISDKQKMIIINIPLIQEDLNLLISRVSEASDIMTNIIESLI